jgi:dTDP-4-amino-4,6-dideoxygalactose transaminase
MTSSSSTSRQVPIIDLGREYDSIRAELTPVLETIFRSGSYILGKQVEQFEKELAAYVGVPHAAGLNSGTDAIWIALKALGIGAGDEVIVPAMSFFATVEPLVHLGAKPVFVDIDPVTYAIDTQQVSKAITPKTKAIIAVHLYGLPADMKTLSQLAKEKGIFLIEDMAQAIGSSIDGKKVGCWGDLACLSFYPTKNLGACGDGGAILTQSPKLAERVLSLRNHGAKVKYHHEEAAFNSRLDEIQAAVLRLKLKQLDGWNDRRRALAQEYTRALQGLPLTLPQEISGRRHVYHLYTLQVETREALRTYLNSKGISVGLHYPIALHRLAALSYLGYKEKQFPVSEALAEKTLSLPLYPFMTSDDVTYVSSTVRSYFD